jgi:diaminohydroxyphosphoribosylaminopyrimidine deaminase/5-amino-6-(5-phosphoribosylamino)uracil reductase
MSKDQDRLHMARALELAARAERGRVSPNPLVGAVIARGDEVVGEGFHAELGGRHAERAAIEDSRGRGADPAGASLFVTLEPCAHQGRQPPCVDAILEAGIARVLYATDDPSEKAAGRGPGILRESGVLVDQAAGEEAALARLLNQPFRKHARTGKPLVTLKMAYSLDGFVAAASGESRWISGEQSRRLVHRWRAEVDAVAIGIGTAVADDPLLTARIATVPRQPARVVFDSQARLPLDSQLVGTVSEAPLVIVASEEAPPGRISALEGAGAQIVVAAGEDATARVGTGLTGLGDLGITSLLLEGGPALASAFAAAGELDQSRLFIAPLLLGGGRPPLWRSGATSVGEAKRALEMRAEPIGEDVLIRARLREW